MKITLLPASLSGRLFLLLLGGVVAATALSVGSQMRRGIIIVNEAYTQQLAERIAATVKLLDVSSSAERAVIVDAITTPTFLVQLGQPANRSSAANEDWLLTTALQEPLRATGVHNVAVHLLSDSDPVAPYWPVQVKSGRTLGPPPWTLEYMVSLQLRDGTPLSYIISSKKDVVDSMLHPPLSLMFLILCLIGLVSIAVRMTTRPLRQLAEAASEFGRNIRRIPLPEHGPTEVRRAAAAFNAMQERINRYVEDRTYALAAVSHDLETPLTRMRLRLERLDNSELKTKFADDLADMQTLIQQGLDLARSVDNREPRQPIDLNALLDSVRADFEEMGHEVTVQGQAQTPYGGQPLALGRCFTNLVSNAIKYGRYAKVFLRDDPHAVCIRVHDGGPGIPPELMEATFRPFYRLEASRNRTTGGAGLGLTIARNIVFAHGGTLQLQNLAAGGLEAAVELPR